MSDSRPAPSRKGIAIAGLRGGSGKTLAAIGLIAALRRRGISAAPFKKGPDYIDPAWLARAAGRDCYNLDTYLLEKPSIIASYLSNNADCDLAVIEGNRGLFDGVDVEGTHSIAGLARMLGVPVILVADCAKASRTVAAMVRGCQVFDPELALAGVILNRVAGERHRSVAAGAVERYCGIPVLGAIPRMTGLDLAERHLGLLPVAEHPSPDGIVEALADEFGRSVDIGAIIGIADRHAYPPLECRQEAPRAAADTDGPSVGVFRDGAFSFYYPENIAALAERGARIVYIDSMKDARLPAVDALYIGGGFPETHAALLSANRSLMDDVRGASRRGLPVYAECGGLVYLSESIEAGGISYPMAGVFPLRFALSRRPEGHGYTRFRADRDNPFFPREAVVTGHEFRYSRLVGASGEFTTAFSMERGTGLAGGRDGIIRDNTLGTFCHTHALGRDVTWPAALVAMARGRAQ